MALLVLGVSVEIAFISVALFTIIVHNWFKLARK